MPTNLTGMATMQTQTQLEQDRSVAFGAEVDRKSRGNKPDRAEGALTESAARAASTMMCEATDVMWQKKSSNIDPEDEKTCQTRF